MIGIIVLTILGIALWALAKGIKFSARAIGSAEDRAENILRALCGFLLAGFLTYPVALGRVVARVACASGVGLDVKTRVDLRTNGYLIDWLPEAGTTFMAQAVDDLLLGRIAFFETWSINRNPGLQRVQLGPSDSRYCVNPSQVAAEKRPPKGTCIQVRTVDARASLYDIETSRGYWRSKPFEKSTRIVEHASRRIAASYTSRRIPAAQLGFSTGSTDVYCPNNDAGWRHSALFALSESALVENPNPVAVAANAEPSTCIPIQLPENFEAHRYRSSTGRRPLDIQIDNSGMMASENDVYVNRPGTPVILLLSSDMPVVWRIRQTADSQIAGILVENRERGAAVVGVKPDVPLMIWTKGYSRMGNCSDAYYTHVLSDSLARDLTTDVKGDKAFVSGDEIVPFVIGPKLAESAYQQYGEIPESQYALTQ